MPGLGIRLADGNLRLEQDGEQVAIRGSVDSNGGTLKLAGRYDPREKQRLLLDLGGIDVEVANLPEARLRVTPDLQLAFDGETWRLGGKIVIPKARIDVSRLESGARRSTDVVVIDDPPRSGAARRPWRAKVEVVLGGDVIVQGFGFDGNVIGLLTVSQRSGRQATGSGELVVNGRYTALGQNFEIEGGRLLFAGGALDNPSLALRATQRFGNNTTTVRINGTAANPELHLGTPDGVTEVDALAALMGSSGTFAFGRYLTPRLFVGYGIGLISGGEVFSVRFRINRSFDIEGTSGAENRAALNYRIER
jgi:translocation and assembly module TamB